MHCMQVYNVCLQNYKSQIPTLTSVYGQEINEGTPSHNLSGLNRYCDLTKAHQQAMHCRDVTDECNNGKTLLLLLAK